MRTIVARRHATQHYCALMRASVGVATNQEAIGRARNIIAHAESIGKRAFERVNYTPLDFSPKICRMAEAEQGEAEGRSGLRGSSDALAPSFEARLCHSKFGLENKICAKCMSQRHKILL